MSSLAHWDPFRTLRRRNDIFDEFFREVLARPEEGAPIEPAVEVAETDKDVTVKVQVPGVEKDQVTISVTDDVLTVRGEVRKETEEKKKNFYRQEFRYGAFERMLGLQAEVDAAKAKGELKNGVLTITLPKSQQPKARQVKIDVA